MSDPAAQIRVYASMQEVERNIKEDGGRERERQRDRDVLQKIWKGARRKKGFK